jgi:hypothetical protein
MKWPVELLMNGLIAGFGMLRTVLGEPETRIET